MKRLMQRPAKLTDSVEGKLSAYQLAANASRIDPVSGLRQIGGYATLAGAASIAAVSLAVPAEAKVVVTKANIPITSQVTVPIDLNHDGVNDVIFSWGSWGHGKAINAEPQGSNGAAGYFAKNGRACASALKEYVRVGANKQFVNSQHGDIMFQINDSSGYVSSTGQWYSVRGRYVGVKFSIKGKTHYGWVRLNVSGKGHGGFDATITGYAYETVANRPIVAGKAKGPDVITVNPGSLGALAAGRK